MSPPYPTVELKIYRIWGGDFGRIQYNEFEFAMEIKLSIRCGSMCRGDHGVSLRVYVGQATGQLRIR